MHRLSYIHRSTANMARLYGRPYLLLSITVLCTSNAARRPMNPTNPFVLCPCAPATEFLTDRLPVAPSNFILSFYLLLDPHIATRSIFVMPANSSPRRKTEARNTAMNTPYRIITYSKRDRLTRSRRTLSDSSSDEPLFISDSDDDRSPTTSTASKPQPKEKEKGKGKAKMVMSGISSDDDVVFIAGFQSWLSPSNDRPEPHPRRERSEFSSPFSVILISMYSQEISQTLMAYYRKQEETLTCSICFHLVNNPYMLWCGHFFCAECLSVHAAACLKQLNNPKCPTCCTVHGLFILVESHFELRQALHLSQPERGTLVWPKKFKCIDKSYPTLLSPTSWLLDFEA
ncbi:hypothetical protein FB446DRAFT_748208 [Lentinula raphanica]|nr:hypothetical protein FB446DRAFT_748208 [Lentinula raphanica]